MQEAHGWAWELLVRGCGPRGRSVPRLWLCVCGLVLAVTQLRHMLQQGLTLHAALGKHGPLWRTHARSHTHTHTHGRSNIGHAPRAKAENKARRNRADANMAPPAHEFSSSSSARTKLPCSVCEATSSAKTRPTSRESDSSMNPRSQTSTCSRVPVSPLCYCGRALTSRPCHGSMLAFLFPASRDCIAAQLGGTGPVPRFRLAGRRGGSP